MSLASKTGQVVFTQKGGVYMTLINSDSGDLFQEYNGESASDPGDITPDFSTLKPTLSFIATSSRSAEGIITPASVKWFFNDTELIFDASGISTNSFNGETGHFTNLPYVAGTRDYYSLQITKNLVIASGGASSIIKCVATIVVGNSSETIQYTYSIPVTKGTGTSKRVTIAAGDSNMFTIKSNGGSCSLKAVAYLQKDEITSSLTYKWYQLNGAEWSLLTTATAKTLTVTDDMIETAGVFKVEIYDNIGLIGMDTQTVTDVSDPYDIVTNPSPADEMIEYSGDSVSYTPVLVQRGSTTAFGTQPSNWSWVAYDSVGNRLGSGTFASGGSFAITYDMCVQAGGNVAWSLTAGDL